jgi:hypothetical protein
LLLYRKIFVFEPKKALEIHIMLALEKIVEIINDGRGLWLPGNHIEEADSIDDPLSFYRSNVSRNQPLIIRGLSLKKALVICMNRRLQDLESI